MKNPCAFSRPFLGQKDRITFNSSVAPAKKKTEDEDTDKEDEEEDEEEETKKMSPSTYSSFLFNLGKVKTRYEMLEGKQHLVVPMVMMVEGVHNGSAGSLYYPEGELAKFPGVWNHKPIVVYHPTLNGQPVSAGDPAIIETQKIGIVLQTEWKGKLAAEAWLDVEKAKKVDNSIIEKLEKGEMIEVSTGLWTENELTPGEWNGEKYTAIARNHRPDHLAVLPNQIGACSIKDGAGLLRNEWSDEARAAAAEARKKGASGDAEKKSTIWGKTGKKGKHVDTGEDTFEEEEIGDDAKPTGATRWVNAKGEDRSSRMPKKKVKNEEVANEVSYDATRDLLRTALQEMDPQSYCYIVDVFQSFCIYEKQGKLWKHNYTSTDTKATLVGEPEAVVRKVEYLTANGEVVANYLEEPVMEKKKLVDSLIANSGGTWIEADREFLMKQEVQRLQSFASNVKQEQDIKAARVQEQPAPVGNSEQKAKDVEAPKQPATLEQFISNAPSGVREVLVEGIRSLAEEKKRLITTITANAKNKFTAEQLNAKGLDDLRLIASLAAPEQQTQQPFAMNFAGLAEVVNPTAGPKVEPLGLPIINFDAPARAKK